VGKVLGSARGRTSSRLSRALLRAAGVISLATFPLESASLTPYPAYERQSHQSRLRAEITRAKTEQGEYLRNVELARVLNKRKAKKEAAGQGTDGAEVGKSGKIEDSGKERKGEDAKSMRYRQRQVVDRGQGLEATGMENVLGNVFG
jgi:ESF2/ABP1 family protein